MMWTIRLACPLALTLLPAVALAQPEPASGDVLNLFYDCSPRRFGCSDEDFFRREIPVVNWVRDREVADLHVLVTSEPTGGGGRLYTLAFIGRGELDGDQVELTVGTPGDATTDEERRAVADRLKIGLVRYLADTPAVDQIRISLGAEQGPAGPGAASPQDDPWNFWVFSVGGNAFLNGESSISSSNYSANVSANRTTDEWKVNLSGRYSRQKSEFILAEDEPPVVSLIEDWRATALLVKSAGEQWSIGVTSGMGRSTRLNEDLRWNVSPGIEYNFFPYTESSRRTLTINALMNLRHWDYAEETIYFRTDETRFAGSVTAAINQVQPWGRTNVSLTWSQYAHDRALNQLSLNGSVSLRVFRGFRVNVTGFYARIRDQLYLPAGEATPEEILLRQRQLETSYNYFVSFGLSYQFGSIFNNIVNPRFGNSGGGPIFFF
jgi:hypothetical protein